MTLDSLKEKATASELTLIAAVEQAVHDEARHNAKEQLNNALALEGPPPEYGSPDAWRSWWGRIRKRFDDSP